MLIHFNKNNKKMGGGGGIDLCKSMIFKRQKEKESQPELIASIVTQRSKHTRLKTFLFFFKLVNRMFCK